MSLTTTTAIDEEETASPTAIRRLFERVYSRGELIHLEDLVAEAAIVSDGATGETYLGLDGVRGHVAHLRRTFHGFAIEVQAIHVDGGTFEVEWLATGTHERRFMGIDPTCIIGAAGTEPHGPEIEVEGLARGTLRDGSIRTCRFDWDLATLRGQLGGGERREGPEGRSDEPGAEENLYWSQSPE